MAAPPALSETIDIGVNLADASFASDRDAVIERARAVGVRRMIVTGTSVEGSRAAAALAETRRQTLFSTAGVHPHDARHFDGGALSALRELASSPTVVAIGECGLDFNRDLSPRDDQRQAFRAQLELAADLSMPVFVHERDAAGDLIAIVDEFNELPPLVVHCFTGGRDALLEYIARGFFIGITGWICDERRGLHLRELVRLIPSDRLMVETDAPYLLPRTIRPRPKSRRNEPAFLPYVIATIAEASDSTPEAVAARTTRTAETFFRLTASAPP